MMQSNSNLVDHLIIIGKKKQHKHLQRLLEKLKPSAGFRGVHEFDSAHIPSPNSEDPPNCWALPVVTNKHSSCTSKHQLPFNQGTHQVCE